MEHRPIVDLCTHELRDDVAFAHHEYAIDQAFELFEVARGNENPEAFAVCQVAELRPDLLFAAHVDALGRLSDQQHRRCRLECAGKGELLLIAAAERRGGHGYTAAADVEPSHVGQGRITLPRADPEAVALGAGIDR